MSNDCPSLCSWFPFSDEPLVNGKLYAPKFCDPCILFPEQSCDGKWHMFLHSWIGIHHFISTSGIAWEPDKVIAYRGHSPYIYTENEKYCLVYEIHDRKFPLKKGNRENQRYSRIEMITSTDLRIWSKPRLLLDSRNVPYAGDYIKNPRVSRPQLVKADGIYRLYFGASHIVLPETGQKASRYFSCAFSKEITGPYVISDEMLGQSDPDDKWTNLGCGSMRIVEHDGRFYAFQCGIYWDDEQKKTHSAIILKQSDDGLDFRQCENNPVLVPAQEGWASSYIMSCDVKYRKEEKCWYCYFSANNGEKPLSKESIGLLIGKEPAAVKNVTEPKVYGTFLK